MVWLCWTINYDRLLNIAIGKGFWYNTLNSTTGGTYMKEELCDVFKQIVQRHKYSYSTAGKLSGMSKTQVNNIINHSGHEVSLEKIMTGLTLLGYKVKITLEESDEIEQNQ
jgi:predicted XRE-type DNA-binding protein